MTSDVPFAGDSAPLRPLPHAAAAMATIIAGAPTSIARWTHLVMISPRGLPPRPYVETTARLPNEIGSIWVRAISSDELAPSRIPTSAAACACAHRAHAPPSADRGQSWCRL